MTVFQYIKCYVKLVAFVIPAYQKLFQNVPKSQVFPIYVNYSCIYVNSLLDL